MYGYRNWSGVQEWDGALLSSLSCSLRLSMLFRELEATVLKSLLSAGNGPE